MKSGYGDWVEPAAPAARKDPRAEWTAAFQTSILPCSELSAIGIPRREKLLGDWFLEGDLGFVFAPRGLGKTWISLAMANAISGGGNCGPWLAHGKFRVVYIDGEMPCEDICARIKGLGGNGNLSVLNHEALFHLSGKVLNFADPLVQEVLTARLVDDAVKVLYLDNLSCLFSGVKENDGDAWELVLPWLLTLRRHRIAVVIIHHSGRNKEMRGTSRREDAAFWVLRLDELQDAERRKGARFLSRFTKDRNSHNEQAAIEWSISTMSDNNVAIGTHEASSMDVLRQWIEDGLTSASDLAEEMHLTKGTISKMATKAMQAGWLKKIGRDYVLA